MKDIELDALFWNVNWTETPLDEFKTKILNSLSSAKGFVIHGNYNKIRDVTWKNSEIILWLDYPKYLVMWRVLKRSVSRILCSEELWAGNKESLQKTFLSKKSIILWAWNTYDLRKSQYTKLIAEPEYNHIKVLRFTSQKDLDYFLVEQGLI